MDAERIIEVNSISNCPLELKPHQNLRIIFGFDIKLEVEKATVDQKIHSIEMKRVVGLCARCLCVCFCVGTDVIDVLSARQKTKSRRT